MSTPNFGLPLITGNMTANVPRDMNALAEATDIAIKEAVDGVDLSSVTQQIDAVDQRVATHLASENPSAHKAKSIVLDDIAGLFTSGNVEAAMQELFTNVSNGKVLIGTAITDVDPTKVVPNNPTFQQLGDLIKNITVGKKFAKGTVNSTSAGKFIVSGLLFTPKILLYWRNSDATSARSYNGMYVYYSEFANMGFTVNHSIVGSSYLQNSITVSVNGFEANTGFPQAVSYNYFAFA